jgi:two-component system, cell cycle response regulator
MAVPSRQPIGVRIALLAASFLLGAFVLHAALDPGRDLTVYTDGVYNAVLIIASAVTLARGIAVRAERLPWLLIGAAMALWTVGDIYFSAALEDLDSVPIPSLADAFYLAFYPLAYAGLVLLVRSRVQRFHRGLWLDGLIAALAVGAVSAAVVVHAVSSSLGDAPTAEVATNMAYPLGDLGLLALVVAILAMTGWRPGRTWALLAAGLLAFGISDSLYLFQSANDAYTSGTLVDVGWPAAMLVVAFAAWQPPTRHRRLRLEGWRVMAAPAAFGIVCLGLLVWGTSDRLDRLALVLATAAMLVVIVRMALTFGDSVRMLASSREDAKTDPLTNLGNRRALMADLAATVEGDRQHALALLDLNGFKTYNDTFGHPAGDALLVRLGTALGATIEHRGRAYRMGGDEFCLLFPVGAEPVDAVVAAASAALTERGEGFTVSSAYGVARVPEEASTASDALKLADRRMYAQKNSARPSAGRQSGDVLLRALTERNAALGDHLQGVADLATAVGVAMGLAGEDLEDLRRAAALHDVGKMAIPDAILDKPGPLSGEEWSFVRRHTLVGERILAAAPALHRVSRLVRASHERYDGTGYPDRLAGDDIPLGARIIFVCDAFDAMISERPYHRAASTEEALDELRRCAGTQFDPHAVEAFAGVLAARSEVPTAL